MGRPYIRKHRDKYLIEQKVGKTTKHLCTFTAEEVLEFKKIPYTINEAYNKNSKVAYKSTRKKKKKSNQKFLQELLSEPKQEEIKQVMEEIFGTEEEWK